MDSFLHNHQSALDSQREDKAIHVLENAGIYPEPDNDGILESLYEEVLEENPNLEHEEATKLAQDKFEQLPEPGDYDD